MPIPGIVSTKGIPVTVIDRPPAPTASASGRGGLLGTVRRHPLLTFFLLANSLSWLAWLPYILSLNGLGLWGVEFPALLGSSQLLGVLPGAYLGQIGSALLVTTIVDGRAGLRRWVGRLLRWNVNWRWYAIALLAVPTGALVAGLLFSGGAIQAPSMTMLAVYLPVLVETVVVTLAIARIGAPCFSIARICTGEVCVRSTFGSSPSFGSR